MGDLENIQINRLLGTIMHELTTHVKKLELFNLERGWMIQGQINKCQIHAGRASRKGLDLVLLVRGNRKAPGEVRKTSSSE